MIANKPILFGAWISPYMSMVAQMLMESGIDFHYECVSPFAAHNRADAHLERNPIGKIPCFKDNNGLYVSESQSICRYLARTYPSARQFYPCDNPTLCSKVDALNDFLTFSISGPFFSWFVVSKHFPVAWKLETQKESQVFSQWSELLVNGDMARLIDTASMSPFLLGADPYLPDFHLFYLLEHGKTFSRMLDDPSFDFLARHDKLMPFYEAMSARPATQEILNAQAAEFDQNKKEYFNEMESGFSDMLRNIRPALEAAFGHKV